MTSPEAKGQRRTVCEFTSQQAVEEAYQALQKAGLPPEQLSINREASDPNPKIAQSQARSSAIGGAIAGGVLGSLVGLLISLSALKFPDANPLAGSNPILSTVVAILAGGVVGVGAFGLIGALSGVNVPKEETSEDQQRLSQRYLVTIQGTEDELMQAKEILRQQGGRVWGFES